MIDRTRARQARALPANLIALEARTLLDATFTGTDSDGDEYTINLVGEGTLDVLTSGANQTGSISSITASGTELLSRLSISVNKAGGGNGRVVLGGLSADDLESFIAPDVDLESGSITVNTLGTLVLGDILGGGLFGDSADESRSMSITLRRVSTPAQVTASITTGGRISTFTAQEWSGPGTLTAITIGQLSITGGSGSSGAFSPDLELSGFQGVVQTLGRARIAGEVSGTWTISGASGPIEAGLVSNMALTVSGRLDGLRSRLDLTATVIAVSIGFFEAKGVMGGSVNYSGADAKGVGIKSIKAANIVNFTALGDPAAGRIDTLASAGGLTGSVTAPALLTLSAKGNAELALSLTGITGQTSLRRATFGGTLTGTWNITGDVGSISTRGDANTLGIGTNARVNTLSIGGAANDLSVVCDTLGTLSSRAAMSATVDVNGVTSRGRSADTIRSGGAMAITMLDTPGAIGAIQAVTMTGQITGQTLASLRVTGARNVPGDADDLSIRMAGTDSRGTSVGRIDVRGTFLDSGLYVAGNILAASFGRLIGSQVAAGSADLLSELPADLTFLIPNLPEGLGVINSLKVTQKFDLAVTAFTNSIVAARAIGTASVTGRSVDQSTGTPFGFAADFIKALSLRTPAGGSISYKNLTNPEVLFPVGNPSDIRVSVL